MGLPKTLIDMPAADGLQQKADLRRLPPGKSAQALNLVKNKYGRLEKRLGFQPLATTDPFGSGYSFSQGINLGTWNQSLLAAGRGNWAPTASTVTALSTYSDDLGGMVHRGQLPDLKVTGDTIIGDTPTLAAAPSVCIIGDYAVMVWGDGAAINTDTIQTWGNVYWTAWELSTGNIIQPTTILFSQSAISYIRLAAVGTSWVMCCSGPGSPGTIECSILTQANLLAPGTSWVTNVIITDQCTQTPTGAPFDMRSVTNDATAFVLAYEKGQVGTLTTPVSIVAQRWTVSGTTATLAATFVAQPSPSSTIAQVAFGLRADAASGRCCIVYCQPTSLTFPDAATVFKVHAATCTYPAMAFVNGSSTNDTIIYSGTDVHEPWPIWIDVVQNGSGGQLAGGTWWTAFWSPEGSVWNNQAQRGGTQQNNPNRIVNTAATKRLPIASRCARIIGNSFRDGSNSLTLGNAGATASITPGLILASRGLEVNGVAYFLGWVPSYTQGGFIALAFDQMKNQIKSGTGYPMRPVANLQVRTALGDPGYGSLINDTSASYSVSSVSPNQWSGASEWQVGSDIYGTSYVGYVAGTQGARFQPAYGALQTLPISGYPMAQWGSLTGIGGGLPMCFDGSSVFEQGFLYAPDSVLVDPGSATLPNPGPANQILGPYWTTVTTDSYSWVFTWEQFDTQGNFHISARSTPVTVTSAQLAVYDGSGSGNGYRQPTFYVPTLGATYRQQFGGTANPSTTFINTTTPPIYPPTLGVYRTARNGQVFYRVADRYFNSSDSMVGTFPTNKTDATMFVTYKDTAIDLVAYNQWVADGGLTTSPAYFLDGGTFPLLYTDGSTGAPGSLDNFCPPSSSFTVRHKERLFVARGNQVLFTKQRGELAGPGYNEQVNAFTVGDASNIIGMESMDDKLIIFKPNQLFYVGGDGPADDGTGSAFQPPQPIPTDSGCSDPSSIKSTPEGIYFMSTAGLRRLSRSLGVEYVGGPVEDELALYSDVRSVVLYPGQNRVVFAVTGDDTSGTGGEMIWRDYVLDAWTTAKITDGANLRVAISLAVANAPRAGNAPNNQLPVLHFFTKDGVVWRERDPAAASAFFDNSTYISSSWQSPLIKQGDSSRFRLWDVFVVGNSADPHGLIVTITRDDGTSPVVYTWNWQTGSFQIAPNGAVPTGLTRLRNYDGRMGTDFQVTIQDVSDSSSVSGQGLQLLGLSLAIGVMPGPYKTPPSSTQ